MNTFLRYSTVLVLAAAFAPAQEATRIALPKPQTEGGKPLMQVLKERRSSREFSPEKLSPQVLSNLLWAGFGVSRPDGKRTAPSARNQQEISIYVALAEGLYVYNAKENALDLVVKEDLRKATGPQPFVGGAPLNLVYVASKTGDDQNWAFADTGFIAENVYLYCASEGLACVVRGMVDKPSLSKAMKLGPGQTITLAHTIGYPAKK
jgi:nitroreductase